MLPSGHVRITGRVKDVIIRNAENISATEMEECSTSTPRLPTSRSSACPIPGPASGAARWCSSPTASTTLTLAEIGEHCRSVGLATQKIPEQLEIVDEIPRNPWARSESKSCATAMRALADDRPSSVLGERAGHCHPVRPPLGFRDRREDWLPQRHAEAEHVH